MLWYPYNLEPISIDDFCVNHTSTLKEEYNATSAATDWSGHFYCTCITFRELGANNKSPGASERPLSTAGGMKGKKWPGCSSLGCFFYSSPFYSPRIPMTPTGNQRLLNPKECALWTVQKARSSQSTAENKNMPTGIISHCFEFVEKTLHILLHNICKEWGKKV